jgi:hypothetical protein
MERVSLDRNNAAILKFSRAAHQHCVRKIRSQDGSCTCGTMAEQRQSHIPGPAADVEDRRLRSREDSAESARRSPPPQPVNVTGQHMIQQVVAWGDAVEHLLDCN